MGDLLILWYNSYCKESINSDLLNERKWILKNKKLINWLCLSGILSIIFYLLHDVIGTMNYSGYN